MQLGIEIFDRNVSRVNAICPGGRDNFLDRVTNSDYAIWFRLLIGYGNDSIRAWSRA